MVRALKRGFWLTVLLVAGHVRRVSRERLAML